MRRLRPTRHPTPPRQETEEGTLDQAVTKCQLIIFFESRDLPVWSNNDLRCSNPSLVEQLVSFLLLLELLLSYGDL